MWTDALSTEEPLSPPARKGYAMNKNGAARKKSSGKKCQQQEEEKIKQRDKDVSRPSRPTNASVSSTEGTRLKEPLDPFDLCDKQVEWKKTKEIFDVKKMCVSPSNIGVFERAQSKKQTQPTPTRWKKDLYNEEGTKEDQSKTGNAECPKRKRETSPRIETSRHALHFKHFLKWERPATAFCGCFLRSLRARAIHKKRQDFPASSRHEIAAG
jgi:hypothetical protein